MAFTRKITTKKGTIRWQCRWAIPGPNGRLQERSQNFATLKEAKAYAVRMQETESHGVGDPHRHDLARYLRGWLAHLRQRDDLAPTTLHSYERQAEAAIHHVGHILLERLSPLDLDRLYATLLTQGGRPRADGKPSRPLTRRSTMHVHRVLHTALGQARKWRLIPVNPAADATPPSVPEKQTRGFTEDEIRRMLAAAESDAEGSCILALLLTTGLRRSEVLGLALDSIDFDAGTLSVRRTVTSVQGKPVLREVAKTKSSRRTLSVPAAVVTLLRAQKARVLEAALAWGPEYSRQPMFLFPGMAGAPMPPLNLTHRLRQFRRRASVGTDVAPVHGWRHAAATMMIASGVDVKTTQSRLGHSTPVITLQLYADKVDERDRAAGETLAGFLTPRNRA